MIKSFIYIVVSLVVMVSAGLVYSISTGKNLLDYNNQNSLKDVTSIVDFNK